MREQVDHRREFEYGVLYRLWPRGILRDAYRYLSEACRQDLRALLFSRRLEWVGDGRFRTLRVRMGL